jgi:1-acyl-sn-glycerol-3-phosphate acyltransferase
VLTTVLCILAIGKFLAPTPTIRDRVRNVLTRLAEAWISINNFILSLYRNTHWDVEIPDGLDPTGCYVVSCNHRSWVDILVLQRCFNRRIPLLRFFLKRELIRVPFLGVAWWALDFPFVRRHSREEVARRPELRGKDLENARRACEKFRSIPVAMMTFPEGTRFSEEKRERGKARFRNLLKPRIGGLGQVLYALSDQLDAMIDVTIIYPREGGRGGAPSFWDLLTGKVPRIIARARCIDIPGNLLGRDFRTDPDFYGELRHWVDQLWEEKDTRIDRLRGPAASA